MDPTCPPRLRSDLIIQQQVHRGVEVSIVKDPITRRYFRLPARALRVARLFDSDRPIEQVAAAASAQEEESFDPEEVARFGRLLDSLALLDQQLPPDAIIARQRSTSGQRSSIFFVKLPLIDPDRLLAGLLIPLRPLFSVPFLLVLAAAVAGAIVVHVWFYAELKPVLGGMFSGDGWLWLYGITAVTLTTHEFAHGLCCRRFGVEVREMGLLLLYFMPCAYTDISDAYLLPDKWQRIGITLAGSAADLLLWSVATLLLVTVDPGALGQQILAALILTTGFRSLLFNLNPLIKLDGYYVLTDLLELPNLRQRSRRVVGWRVRRWLRRPVSDLEESRRDRRTLEIYGWLSTLYVVALLGVTAVFFDHWIVEWGGASARWVYGAIAGMLLLRWLRRSRVSTQGGV